MALQKQVKSVIFHDGISDDADRFLLQPPAVEYAENLRVDKAGSLKKRPGFGPTALTTVPNTTGTPFFIHAIGDSLYTLTEDGARSFTDGVWADTDLGGFLGNQKLTLESPPVGGMGHIDMLHYASCLLINFTM